MKDKKHWKVLLFLGALTIGFWSMLYTSKLVGIMQREEAKKVRNYADALKLSYTIDENNSEALNFITDLIKNNETIPVILVSDDGSIIDAANIDSADLKNPSQMKSILMEMKQDNMPLEIEFAPGRKQYIYYKNSTVLTLLKYYPFVQLIIIGLFILISYLAFSASRKSEQNRVWVGLAKETAHQLGTPISSMMAWMDYLKEADDAQKVDAIEEISKDLQRLELITDRFSKIGSAPILKDENIYEVMKKSIEYLERRVSKQVHFSIVTTNELMTAKLNISLFDWVIENLCKNAVDAMDGKGSIFITLSEEHHKVYIDIRDTGKGIAKANLKSVFTPGFTTKRRGWGLGLSLAKRIIENYHEGQISIKESEIGKGTTFRIELKN
jgi:two-component system, sporulation sensor kinase E